MPSTTVHLISVFVGPSLLFMAAAFSPKLAGSRGGVQHKFPMLSAVGALIMAVVSTLFLAVNGTLDDRLVSISWPLPISLGTYFDSLTATMLLLVTFIGLIIVRFSARYLDGDANQPKFLKLICLTLGSVSLLVISGNIFMFAIAWLMTSISLHSLLTYYSERPAAISTARKKFVISRLGDLMLVVAIVIIYQLFGTFEYGQIFARAKEISSSGLGAYQSTLLSFASIFIVIGAMTKSAQFPFHSWLPDTLETPTPVSALMHAGIINAGGFLVIRLSPIVASSHLALDLLAVIGAATALLGVVCMMPQTSVKRSLAYSTMAQMGFMMLQCGLGAFSAALLHIVAHSLYKAHAFLSSGSVLESRLIPSSTVRTGVQSASMLLLAAAVFTALGLLAASYFVFEFFSIQKPGSWVLGFILVLALTQLLWASFSSGVWSVAFRGVGAAVIVAALYTGCYLGFDAILSSSDSYVQTDLSLVDMFLMALVTLGFVMVFALQILINQQGTSQLMTRLYVSASNGFYFDIFVHRIVNFLYRHPNPGSV